MEVRRHLLMATPFGLGSKLRESRSDLMRLHGAILST
jgi:hypothetical protein